MRVTPLQPITKGGLKGFGFSVHFGSDQNPINTSGDRSINSGDDQSKPDQDPAISPIRLTSPSEAAASKPGFLPAGKEAAAPNFQNRLATARELFRLGWDTVRIAAYWNISEAEAERRLTIERSNARGLPNPYEAGD